MHTPADKHIGKDFNARVQRHDGPVHEELDHGLAAARPQRLERVVRRQQVAEREPATPRLRQ